VDLEGRRAGGTTDSAPVRRSSRILDGSFWLSTSQRRRIYSFASDIACV
jgi:hypothetical protein